MSERFSERLCYEALSRAIDAAEKAANDAWRAFYEVGGFNPEGGQTARRARLYREAQTAQRRLDTLRQLQRIRLSDAEVANRICQMLGVELTPEQAGGVMWAVAQDDELREEVDLRAEELAAEAEHLEVDD